MSESKQGPEICDVISAKRYSVSPRIQPFLLAPRHLASHAGVFRGARVSSLGREEIRAPLKRPAWEATRHLTRLERPERPRGARRNCCIRKLLICLSQGNSPLNFSRLLHLQRHSGLASEGGGWNSGNCSIACVASRKAAKDFKSTFPILLTAWQSKQQKHP